MITSVMDVHVGNLRKHGYNNLEEWLLNSKHVYIGRNNGWIKGSIKSKWHNPYSSNKYGSDNCLNYYYQYIKQKLETGELNIQELKEKVLGCWCTTGKPKIPYKCHGEILAYLANHM